MKIVKEYQDGKAVGYRLLLTTADNQQWAHTIGNCWPGSYFASRSVEVEVDANGLVDLWISGGEDDEHANELEAIVAAHCPHDCAHLWPIWAE